MKYQYQPLLDKVTYVDVQVAQPLCLNQQAIKALLLKLICLAQI